MFTDVFTKYELNKSLLPFKNQVNETLIGCLVRLICATLVRKTCFLQSTLLCNQRKDEFHETMIQKRKKNLPLQNLLPKPRLVFSGPKKLVTFEEKYSKVGLLLKL